MRTLVVGGTGTVGSQVVRDLLDRSEDVRILVHSESKVGALPGRAEWVVGDLDDSESLARAFDDVDNAFLLTPVTQNETELGINAVDAAMDSAIEKIVYMSVAMPEGSKHIPHFRSKLPIEEAIASSGLSYTILRPTNFFQNDVMVRNAIVWQGIYPQPIGSKGINRVDVRDIADAAVNALMDSEHDGKTYNIHGPDVFTGESVARTYSRHLDREIRYTGDDLNAWSQMVSGMIPDWLIRDLRIMFEYFQQYGFIVSDNGFSPLREVLKHDQRRFEDFAAEVVQVWNAVPSV